MTNLQPISIEGQKPNIELENMIKKHRKEVAETKERFFPGYNEQGLSKAVNPIFWPSYTVVLNSSEEYILAKEAKPPFAHVKYQWSQEYLRKIIEGTK